MRINTYLFCINTSPTLFIDNSIDLSTSRVKDCNGKPAARFFAVRGLGMESLTLAR